MFGGLQQDLKSQIAQLKTETEVLETRKDIHEMGWMLRSAGEAATAGASDEPSAETCQSSSLASVGVGLGRTVLATNQGRPTRHAIQKRVETELVDVDGTSQVRGNLGSQ